MIGLVACSAKKRTNACPARMMYQGNLFRASSLYVARFCARWAILSAKYGLVLPDEIIAPYNRMLGDLTKEERAVWCSQTRVRIEQVFGTEEEFIVFAGVHYRKCMIGLNYSVPFGLDHMGIGSQVQTIMRNL